MEAVSVGIARTRVVPLEKLRAVVLLCGSVRPTLLNARISRSILDLPLGTATPTIGADAAHEPFTIMAGWCAQVASLAASCNRPTLPLRLLINRDAPAPVTGMAPTVSVERDPLDFRGTGGLLRDLAGGYEDDDVLFVANAAQVLLEPLATLTQAMAEQGADLSMIAHRDLSTSGLMLVRAGALRSIAAIGFVDMKEQALPAIAAKHRVTVVSRQQPSGLAIRTPGDYIRAVQLFHKARAGAVASTPFAEDWKPTFAIVEPGAKVDPTARVHDSVVLAGARVDAGAVLVRSIVTRGGIVARNRSVTDEMVFQPDSAAGRGRRAA